MWRDALLVGGKDVRVELRSRVTFNQTLPFALVVLVLFAFALDPDRGVLERAAPGLFWVAVLFSAVLAVQRSVTMEDSDALRLTGLDGAAVFLGKTGAIALQLVVLELALVAGVFVMYGADLDAPLVLVATCVLATVGVAAAGTMYGALAAGLRVRETLLPLLMLPVLAPVLLAGTRAWEAALDLTADPAGPWLRLLAVFAALYMTAGLFGYGAVLEEA